MTTIDQIKHLSSREIKDLLTKYKRTHNLSRFIIVPINITGFPQDGDKIIDTEKWEWVSQVLYPENSGKWLRSGSAGLLNSDYFIIKFLNHGGPFEAADIQPENVLYGGGIKYRNKMSRRYRYKNRKSLKK
jgi:hypothetical protein